MNISMLQLRASRIGVCVCVERSFPVDRHMRLANTGYHLLEDSSAVIQVGPCITRQDIGILHLPLFGLRGSCLGTSFRWLRKGHNLDYP